MPTLSNAERARRARLLGSVTFIVGLWPFVPAAGQEIPSIPSTTCPSGVQADKCYQGSYTDTVIYSIGEGSEGGEGGEAGGRGPDLNLYSAAEITIEHNAGLNQNITITSDGGTGSNEVGESGNSGNGGDGGDIIFNNEGALTWDAGTASGQVIVTSIVSAGAGALTPDEHGDGGEGGNGGPITLTNNGAVWVFGTFDAGVIGIDANASGGSGGHRNEGAEYQEGGNGGNGGVVTVTNNNWITLGSSSDYVNGSVRARGISATSNGGNGGYGGFSNNEDQGKRGNGGNGYHLSVTNAGQIVIYWVPKEDGTSDELIGIKADSLGGNGADSGHDEESGGNGGSAGDVTVQNSADITVFSQDPSQPVSGGGIVARSLGGSGGVGNKQGDNNTNGAGGNGGGGGEDGGSGGSGIISVTHSGEAAIATTGNELAGILAEARGGAGGSGGSGYSEDNSSGGHGGRGISITIDLKDQASVTTDGSEAPGILAQSVGGTGGDGGNDGGLVGEAGGAGYGGNSSAVTISTEAGNSVTTQGDFSVGIGGQSLGGGGGTGGDFYGVLGGSGGDGGRGGDSAAVTITTAGAVTTGGDHSYGVMGQSIAGGGGAGGISAGAVSLGGDGAAGGTASSVTITNSGTVKTTGYASHGILAQSIAGGGGAGGVSAAGVLSIGGNAAKNNTANGGNVTVTQTGTVRTSGDAAIGLVAQSIGGGGGSGAGAVGIAGVGGKGAAGGDGSTVNITALGTIETAGDYAYGVVAQSVGGGGGNGGDVMTFSALASFGIGGSAAGGGSGGVICIDNTGVSCPATNIGAGAPATIATHGDYATGLTAQSVGGGGGNGGSIQNYSVASLLALQVGGNAGGGGNGDSATIRQNDLTLSTSGAHAIGVLAQSIGGGGGNGGDASYADATIGFNAALIVGGGGGSGGFSSAVTVDLANATIITGAPDGSDPASFAPNDSFGILAQSVGGGGGNGGSSSAKDFLVAAPTFTETGVSVALNYQAAVGGNGGNGGDGCRTTDTNDPCTVSVALTDGTSVTTLGDGSHAVVAQAIGGGGGNGGDSSVLSTTLGDKETAELTAGIALGGGVGNLLPGYVFSGENGGWGGLVDVTLGDPNGTAVSSQPSLEAPPSAIRTYGDYANGVLAQSIGGGGGNAGVGSSNVYSQGGLVSIKASIGLGGVGGAGGSSSLVTVTQNRGHAIQTYGSGSRGVVAQSVGGGGGASQGGTLYLAGGVEGFDGRLTVGVGMTGGSGGDSGGVTATTAGTITTTGGDADGVLLQAIGGGGGLGGSLGADASSHSILDRIGLIEDNLHRLGDGGAYTMTVDVGGKGGTGGHGGTINLDHIGQIDTRGDWADGIVAQSIGGGGGAGGSSTASGSKVSASIAVSVGGKGGTAGSGGEIDAFFDGDDDNHINTAGYSANAVVLQSIGGGGGTGGDGSDKASGTITVGGSAGGTGGTAGDGGAITVRTTSWLTAQTAGDDSIGILAQSVGGGGGTGGAGNSTWQKETSSNAVAVTVGGKGGVSGDGGTIDLTTGTGMNTYGDRAYGVVAQSIGAGGGIGGAGSASNLTSVVLGGQGGAAGDGDSVTLDITAGSSMNTRGAGAHAIVAQSIGGGGGIAGDASGGILSTTPTGHNAAGGSSGNGGVVDVTVDANITASGANAFGVLAQSIGGGGGFGGDQSGGFIGNTSSASAGNGNLVTVTQNGTIKATGEGSVGIFAQSQGPDDQNIVTVNVGGAVTGGSGDRGAGVWIAAGKNNVLTVGAEGSVSAASGVAIRYNGDSTIYDGSQLTVYNSGTITGNILATDMDDNSAGFVTNINGGTVVPAAKASTAGVSAAAAPSGGTLVGASLYQANVVNGGTLIVGHGGKTDSTEITGDFSQSSDGMLSFDIDMASAKSDRLTVRGDATIGGKLKVNAISVLPDITLPFLTVGGTLEHSLSAQSAIFDYAVSRAGNELSVSAESAHFAEPGFALNDDQDKIADHLQEIWDAGGGSFGTLFGTLGSLADDDGGSYESALSDMSPGVSGATAAGSIAMTQQRLDLLLSCPMFADGTSSLVETSCVWSQADAQALDQKAGGGVSGFDATTYALRAGAQFEVSPNWFVGIAGGYDRSDIRGDDDRVNADGDTLYAGVSLKHEIGPWLLSGAIAGSYGWYDNTRSIRIPGFTAQAEGDPEVYNLSARVRAAYTFAQDPYYVRPLVDLDLIYSHASGYRESGAGALDLLVDDAGQWSFHATPAIEVGTRVEVNETTVMRAFAGAGVSFSSVDSWDTSTRLASAPAGIGTFDSEVPLADVVGRFTAGLDLAKDNGFSVRVEYNGSFSDTYTSHGGSLRLSHKF